MPQGHSLRNSRTARVLSVRDMTVDDIRSLQEPAQKQRLAKLRDSHHHVARLVASGLTNLEVAARTGRSLAGVVNLKQAPAMIELIARYRSMIDESWKTAQDEYYELLLTNSMKAERQIADKLDEADERGETLPTRELIAISRDAADRTGYGKRSTVTNLNVDFAAKLEAAMARSQKVIEHE